MEVEWHHIDHCSCQDWCGECSHGFGAAKAHLQKSSEIRMTKVSFDHMFVVRFGVYHVGDARSSSHLLRCGLDVVIGLAVLRRRALFRDLVNSCDSEIGKRLLDQFQYRWLVVRLEVVMAVAQPKHIAHESFLIE